MAQEQVLEHEVLAWAYPDQDGHEEQPEEFKQVPSIADQCSRGVLPHNSSSKRNYSD